MMPRHLVVGLIVVLVAVLVLGVYVGRMHYRAAQLPPAASDARPIEPPGAGPTEPITLYVADDAAGTIRPYSVTIPLSAGRQQRANLLVAALLAFYRESASAHAIPVASELRAVYLIDSDTAVIDLNAAFADGHRSGVLIEELSVLSLVESLSENVEGIRRVKILIDGKTRDTLAGHADLSEFYDSGSAKEAAVQMGSD